MTDRPEPITDDDEGKPIVDAEGDQIGVVEEVEDATVYVAVDDDVSSAARESLGSAGEDAERSSIPPGALQRIPAGDAESYVETFRADPDALDDRE